MAWQPATLWERTKPWTTAASSAGLHLPTPPRLDEDGVYVRRPVAQNLMFTHTARYEQKILPWKGQNRPSLWTMSKGTQLLTSNEEDSMGALGASERTAKGERPISYEELISFIFHRSCTYEASYVRRVLSLEYNHRSQCLSQSINASNNCCPLSVIWLS